MGVGGGGWLLQCSSVNVLDGRNETLEKHGMNKAVTK